MSKAESRRHGESSPVGALGGSVIRERTLTPSSGYVALGLLLPLMLVWGWLFITGVQAESPIRSRLV